MVIAIAEQLNLNFYLKSQLKFGNAIAQYANRMTTNIYL